jgi:isopenicillin N synthase-like dioxygenase
VAATPHLPVIDVAPLLDATAEPATVLAVATRIDRACRDVGFFAITGHGLDPDLRRRLDHAARAFFALPTEQKAEIAMARSGAAWRGWFPLDGELTRGVPDHKEGLYLGLDHAPDHPRVLAGVPLHGPNAYPAAPAELEPAVREWLDRVVALGQAVLGGIALGLGLDREWFALHLTADPTVLLRIFRYPPTETADGWGVAEHTDYGLLTLLAQDDCGGLEVRVGDDWLEVPADPDLLVCNLGDMLDRLTEGRYRSTPHRVRNASGRERISIPLFLDPSWDAEVVALPLAGSPPADDADRRWDGASVHAWEGTYGEYLTAKVARVFPDLFRAVAPTVSAAAPPPRSPAADPTA